MQVTSEHPLDSVVDINLGKKDVYIVNAILGDISPIRGAYAVYRCSQWVYGGANHVVEMIGRNFKCSVCSHIVPIVKYTVQVTLKKDDVQVRAQLSDNAAKMLMGLEANDFFKLDQQSQHCKIDQLKGSRVMAAVLRKAGTPSQFMVLGIVANGRAISNDPAGPVTPAAPRKRKFAFE